MSKTRATAEFIRTGQQRAYGDTITEAIITVEMSNYFEPDTFRPVAVGEDQAKRIAKGLVGWTEQGEGDPFSTYLNAFEVLGEGRYRVVTRAIYND